MVKIISISLINGDTKENLELINQDIILIRYNPKYNKPETITITGEINIPGQYTLQKRWEGLDNMLYSCSYDVYSQSEKESERQNIPFNPANAQLSGGREDHSQNNHEFIQMGPQRSESA